MQKNHKVKLYAKALSEVLLDKKSARSDLTQNFLRLLAKEGLQKKANEILGLAEDFILAKQGGRKIVFEVARKLGAGHRALLKEFVKEKDIVKEKINHELIAGVKIIINNEKQFDNSLKNKLQNIL